MHPSGNIIYSWTVCINKNCPVLCNDASPKVLVASTEIQINSRCYIYKLINYMTLIFHGILIKNHQQLTKHDFSFGKINLNLGERFDV